MTRFTKTSLFTAAAAVLAIGATALSAHARSQAPFLGRSWLASEEACFSESYGTVTNNGTCGTGAKKYVLPLVMDSAGWFNAYVNAYSPVGGQVTCQTWGMGNKGDSFAWSAPQNIPVYNANTDIVMTGAGIQNWGYAFIACDMKPNTRLNSLNY